MSRKWFFPATRLTRALRKAGYVVEVERYIPLLTDAVSPRTPEGSTETFYTVYESDKHRRYEVGYYTSDLPWEGLRIKRCSKPEAAKIMGKYAELPEEDKSKRAKRHGMVTG